MLVHASCTVLQPFFLDNLLLVVYVRSFKIWKSTILGDLEAHSIFGHRLFGDLCSNSPYGNQLLIFAPPSWQLALQPYFWDRDENPGEKQPRKAHLARLLGDDCWDFLVHMLDNKKKKVRGRSFKIFEIYIRKM